MTLCKWCGSPTTIYAGPVDRPDWQRWLCKRCASIGYIDDPVPNDLAGIYTEAWNASANTGNFAAGSTTERIALSILSAVGWSHDSGNCLDYGGGKGAFAKTLVNQGEKGVSVFEPYGRNPGLTGVSWYHAWDDLGKGRKFDWVFMLEVLEHLLHPEEELKKIRQYLAPGGKLVITTPNAKGWRARREGMSWREAQNSTHVNLFAPIALKTCLQRAGFAGWKRIFRPVRYNASGLLGVALAATQIIGVDGGIRVIATVK